MITDAVNKAHCKHITHEGAASVTDKWQRNACNRQDLDGHSDILKHMKGYHANNSCTYIRVKRVIGFNGGFN